MAIRHNHRFILRTKDAPLGWILQVITGSEKDEAGQWTGTTCLLRNSLNSSIFIPLIYCHVHFPQQIPLVLISFLSCSLTSPPKIHKHHIFLLSLSWFDGWVWTLFYFNRYQLSKCHAKFFHQNVLQWLQCLRLFCWITIEEYLFTDMALHQEKDGEEKKENVETRKESSKLWVNSIAAFYLF